MRSITFSTPPTPGGILYEKFPVEIIDEIYGYLLSEYNIRWYYSTPHLPRTPAKPMDNFPILRTSKKVRADALISLCSKGIIKYSTDICDEGSVDVRARRGTMSPLVTFPVHLWKTVAFIIWQPSFSNSSIESATNPKPERAMMKRYCEATIDRFQGTEITRNTFRVRLIMPPDIQTSYVTDPLVDSLKNLIGFEKVILEWQLMRFVRSACEDAHRNYSGWIGYIDCISDRLEEGLGPSTKFDWQLPVLEGIKNVTDWERPIWEEHDKFDGTKSVRWLEFRPREHARKISEQQASNEEYNRAFLEETGIPKKNED